MWLGRVSAVHRSGARGKDSAGSDSTGGICSDRHTRHRRPHHVKESHSIKRQTWVHREEA